MDSSTRRLADLACALRQLDQCPDPEDEEGFTQTSLKPLTEIEKTQQDLLDGLAFLVPSEKTAEQVAAVGMEEDRDNRMLRFFVAMNGTVPEQNVDAIQQIINLICNSQSAVDFESIFANILQIKRQILRFVIASKTPIGMQRRLKDACKLRIDEKSIPFDRKLKISPEEARTSGPYTEASHAEHMKAALQRLRNLAESCNRSLNELKVPAAQLNETIAFIMACYELRHNQCLKYCLIKSSKIPGGEKIYQQIRKLARYRQTALNLSLGVKFIKEFSTVRVEAVPATPSMQTEPSAQSLEELLSSFTDGGRSGGYPANNEKQRMFRVLRRKPLHVHAEVELVVYLMSRSKTPSRFIGCSKLSCFLCNMFLHYSGKFRARGTHRKLYTGWMIPNNPLVLRTLLNTAHLMCQSLEQSLVKLTKRQYIQRKPLQPDSISGISATVLDDTLPEDATTFISNEEISRMTRGLLNKPNTSYREMDERLASLWHTVCPEDSGDEYSCEQDSATANQHCHPASTSRRICASCEDDEAEAQYPCPHCGNVWYCNEQCMKGNWSHKFSCTVPLKSADYLIKACSDDMFPEEDAFRDYGFESASPEERSKLLGLYQGCIMEGIDADVLHGWWSKDILAEMICETFERLPSESRGNYYEWFLSNKDIVSRKSTRVPVIDLLMQKRQSYLPLSDRGISMQHLPESKQTISLLYAVIQCGWNPGPGDGTDLWGRFGFFACNDTMEEHRLALFYKQIFDLTTFVQFHQAYLDGSLDKLAENVGLKSAVLHWKSRGAVLGLHPQRGYPSVYDLKEFALSNEVTPSCNSIKADYGFYNCKTPQERALWKSEYAKLFKVGSCNLIDLHEACIKGKIYDYMKKLRPETPVVFKRLTKNLYPLSEH